MGAKSSRPRSAPGQASAGGPGMQVTALQGPQGTVQSGPHSPLPVDQVQYMGPKLEYLLINVQARMDVQANFLSAGGTTTNVDAYYPTLVQPYPQGYKMVQFQTIPGVRKQQGWFSQAIPFQAILMRPLGVPPSHERWRLQIVKSVIDLQRFYTYSFGGPGGTTSNTSDVMNKIMEMTQQGARLICLEPTGAQQNASFSSGFQGHLGSIGVDLLFHIPEHPNPTPYIYSGFNVQIQYSVKIGFGNATYQCLTDINGQFAAYLNQGWKLVEINMDMSSMGQATGMMSSNIAMNSMWFFEKEAALAEDTRPRWQGCIVNYHHKVKISFGGTETKNFWDPVIVEMGQRGWELACVLETPETKVNGMSSMTLTVLLFFQRPIYYPPA